MSDELRLLRDERPVEGTVFVVTPYGVKANEDGSTFDFDQFYKEVLEPTIAETGMTAVRADEIYGAQSVMGPIWRGLQQGEVVLVDFSHRSPNVALEYGLGMLIGKKMVYLTQDPDDIPSDVRGRVRYIAYNSHFTAVSRMREALKRELAAIRQDRAKEMMLVPLAAGGTDLVPARVITVTKEFVVVETADGRRGVLSNADVDYTRLIKDMSQKYAVGDHLNGAFDVDTTGGMKYTLLANEQNPWPTLAAERPVGSTLTTTVHTVVPSIGAFAPVGYGVSGLIPASTLQKPGGLAQGTEVEVVVTRLDTERRQVSLQLRKIVHQAPAAPAGGRDGLPPVGMRTEGEIVKIKPEGEGGFVLVRLPRRLRPAMLHCNEMLPELREDLNNGQIEVGELVDVEVIRVDPANDKVMLREVEPPAEGAD